MKKGASEEEKNMVVNDIMTHFHPEEFLDLKNFTQLWDIINARKGQDQHWKELKERGIKSTYQQAYYDLKRVLA